jgi:DNA repair exonuclease SbcCD ATPase subunit
MFSMYTVRSLHADTAEDTSAIDALVGTPDNKDLQISTLLSIVKVLRAELQKRPDSSTSIELQQLDLKYKALYAGFQALTKVLQETENKSKLSSNLIKVKERIDKLESQLQEANEKLQKENEKLQEVKLAKERAEEQTTMQQAELDQLRAEAARENLARETAEAQTTQLQTELVQLRAEAARENLARETAEAQTTQLQKEIDQLRMEVAHEKSAKETVQEKVIQLQIQIKTQADELSTKADELGENADKFQKENNKLKIQLKTMEQQLGTMQQQQEKQIESGLAAHKELQMTIEALNDSNALLGDKNSGLESQLQELSVQSNRIKKLLQENTEKLTEFEAKLHEKDIIINKLQEATEEQQQIVALASAATQIEQVIENLVHQARIQQLKLALQRESAEAQATASIAELTKLHSYAKQLQKQVNEQNSKHEQENLEVYRQLATLEKDNSELKQNNAELKQENCQLEKEKHEVRVQLATLENDNSELKQNNSELKQENSSLKAEKSTQSDAKVHSLQAQVQHLITVKTQDSGKLAAAEKTIFVLREEVAKLKREGPPTAAKKSQKTPEQNLSIKIPQQLEELRTKKDQEILQVRSEKDTEIEELRRQKDQEIEHLTLEIKKFQNKLEHFQRERDKEKEKGNEEFQKVITDNREHRRNMRKQESTARVPGNPSSSLSSTRNKSHGEPTARPESKITTMTVQELQALYTKYSEVPDFITKHTLDREPHLVWDVQLNNLKTIKEQYIKEPPSFLPSIIRPPDTIDAQDVRTIENIETKLAQMICSVERTAMKKITGWDYDIKFWFTTHDDFMRRAKELYALQVNISKLVKDVKNLPRVIIKSQKIKQCLKIEDNDSNVEALIQEFEHLHQESHRDNFTVADRQRLEKLQEIMVRLLCWIERKPPKKSSIEDTSQELQFSLEEKHVIEQWAKQREQSHSKEVQEQEVLQVEEFDPPPPDVHFHTPNTRTTIPHNSHVGIEEGLEDSWEEYQSWLKDQFDKISDDRNPLKEIDPGTTKNALQEANIANPYMLSPNVCIEA